MAETADHYIKALLDVYPKGVDLSLTRIGRLLSDLGNPHLQLPPVIHIAGTNGKGSAGAFCRALLEAAGLRVHVHTSPHLVHVHERYRIGRLNGGHYVDDAELLEILQHITTVNDQQPITVFEIITAAAFVLFARHPADAVILEVGLGGRFDATNIIPEPAVSLIMPVALDHQAFLGDTVEQIAFEKAGIIKDSTPVVIGFQAYDGARDVLLRQAEKHKAPVAVYGQDFSACVEHGRMAVQSNRGLLDLPRPRLVGDFQLGNAAAAIEAVYAAGFHLDETTIATAMQKVEWPARMQKLHQGHLKTLLPQQTDLWLDGGHNPAAAQVTSAAMRLLCQQQNRKLALVCGMISTKDSNHYLEAFKGLAERVYTVPVHFSEAGVPADLLAQAARGLGFEAQGFDTIAGAFTAINADYATLPAPVVLVSGSLYLAGEVLQQNGTKPV
ncbi:MAG: Folylpolyglutamate synthase [Candidatus Tokpelaia hoelldobleri]|uniref:Dihydrofolate synthase/folylpolyglutamate synthase n=1 Tax=Candidatus Tokpelaia hoelldobleri TaxID=1902579 RepID=A0A1U9JWZ1_9HYPH|nr:MAG: Folylpolyglutamate synthase [Candidatus Tokpelaia hoelldoblerii]